MTIPGLIRLALDDPGQLTIAEVDRLRRERSRRPRPELDDTLARLDRWLAQELPADER